MNTTTVTPADLKLQLQQHLKDDLEHVNAILRRQLRSQSSFVAEITEHVARYQGKQIRPILLLLTQRMLSDIATPDAHTLAAAVEMIHTATLVHDDVIDEADTRRHVATVHRRWNTETSVLLGDYLFSKSFHLAASTGDAEACRLIGKATDRTCEGELNQIAARLEQSTSEVDYFRIVRDKTGQLFGLSCLLGARAAKADPAVCASVRRYGMRLGMAFQIADDILDLTQTADVTGKDAGNDLQNRRLTLPLLRALQHSAADSHRQELLHRLTGEWAAEENEPRSLPLAEQPIIRAGIESASRTARKLVDRAIGELKRFGDNENRQLLETIALFAVRRNH